MFIGYYELEGKEHFNIYYKTSNGYKVWNTLTFSPTCKNIKMLDFKISGKTYQERKASLEDLAIEFSNNFASLSWSWGEIAEITNYFYENGKRYGLLKEFKENAIC